MSSVSLLSLTQSKRSQLHQSASKTPFFVHIASYETKNDEGVTYYSIELGIRGNESVTIHKVTKRYSQIEKFDKIVRKNVINNTLLNAFPPKRFLFNTEKNFVQRRAQDLQSYLGSLTKIPNMLENEEFRKFFDLD